MALQGKRYSLPNSRIMIHQPLGGAQGQAADIEIQANEILHHKLTLNGYLAEFTGQSMEQITMDTGRGGTCTGLFGPRAYCYSLLCVTVCECVSAACNLYIGGGQPLLITLVVSRRAFILSVLSNAGMCCQGASAKELWVQRWSLQVIRHVAHSRLTSCMCCADRDFFMSAQEAVEYGLIDAVVSRPMLLAASGNGAALS